MDNKTFNDLVDNIAKVALSCDFHIGDADEAIRDGISDNDYTWGNVPVSREEFDEAVAAALPLVEDMEKYYSTVVQKYMR